MRTSAGLLSVFLICAVLIQNAMGIFFEGDFKQRDKKVLNGVISTLTSQISSGDYGSVYDSLKPGKLVIDNDILGSHFEPHSKAEFLKVFDLYSSFAPLGLVVQTVHLESTGPPYHIKVYGILNLNNDPFADSGKKVHVFGDITFKHAKPEVGQVKKVYLKLTLS